MSHLGTFIVPLSSISVYIIYPISNSYLNLVVGGGKEYGQKSESGTKIVTCAIIYIGFGDGSMKMNSLVQRNLSLSHSSDG